jgi:hypothetical protein
VRSLDAGGEVFPDDAIVDDFWVNANVTYALLYNYVDYSCQAVLLCYYLPMDTFRGRFSVPSVSGASGMPAIPGPLISDDPVVLGRLGLAKSQVVGHVYWDGTRLIDSIGNNWVMNGTVPMVQGDTASGTPAGAGPFSDTNYYSLPGSALSGSANGFMIVCVFSMSSISGTQTICTENNAGHTNGYWAQVGTGTPSMVLAGTPVQAPVNASLGQISVLAFSRTGVGNNNIIRASTSPTTALASAGFVAEVAAGAFLGRFNGAGQPFNAGVIYEVWWSNQAGTANNLATLVYAITTALGASNPTSGYDSSIVL